MISMRGIFLLLITPLIEANVYLYKTDDSLSVEFYDCVSDKNLHYCRRPFDPIALQRHETAWLCYHNGTPHSFASLELKNVNASTVMHQWRSSIEKAEEYSRYRKQRQANNSVRGDDRYLCECNHPQSFGKNCEYLLPMGTTFRETLDWEVKQRRDYPWQMQLNGNIVCYATLRCDSGLLCLDWRDICDAIQQCMSGYDEENCDMLEFNECEDDEYRCINGMCIPDDYFLDGEYDCADLSDEKGSFDDTKCHIQETSHECDDRMCIQKLWSCGDGQCIEDRLAFQTRLPISGECNSRRDQFYQCETHYRERQWTLPSGKCSPSSMYEEATVQNRSASEECIYLVKCALSQAAEKNCPCKFDYSCINQLENVCSSSTIRYPNSGILAPYAFSLYNAVRDWSRRIPDLIEINATIKCRGYMLHTSMVEAYGGVFAIGFFDAILCFASNSSVFSNGGYDQYCHNDSRTFSNRSYNFIDVCSRTRECISAYRIKDVYNDCLDFEDEERSDLVLKSCSNIHRHRFRCSSAQLTCLPVSSLGDLYYNCDNKHDEFYEGKKEMLSKIVCNVDSKDGCELIRKYIEDSWTIDSNDSSNVEQNSNKIPFRAFCDTFWDLGSRNDENVTCREWWTCLENQWQCRTGQCIEAEWVLDGEWDCPDASDEEALLVDQNALSTHNLNVINIALLKKRFTTRYNKQPFWKICNLSAEYPCFRMDASDPLNITHNRPCISLHQIGDGHVDCVGQLDERNLAEHCTFPAMLGYEFKCSSNVDCVSYAFHCLYQCEDKHVQCYGHEQTPSCSDESDFMCLNGTCIKWGWCNGELDCSHGEDEYMCFRGPDLLSKSMYEVYREKKELHVRTTKQQLQLPQFPIIKDEVKVVDMRISMPWSISTKSSSFDEISLLTAYRCNRGVGVQLYNASIACFCPQQYYGDKCQFHSDRLTVLFHLNLSQSIYTQSNNSTAMLKMLIIFLYEDQPLMTEYFFTQPADKLTIYKKSIHNLLYSRSNRSLQHKRARYFNRSNLIDEHPYSVRIEAYELNLHEKARLVGVWLYPVYFDFLPSFRLAKVLHLTKHHIAGNPCRNNPCGQHRECHPILNQKSNYICLCPANFKGKDCSILDNMCKGGFCSTNALCKPNYQGLINGNERPYCICPLNEIGDRCDLVYDKCHPNPCENDGKCFPITDPDQFSCMCTEKHYGNKCELEKSTTTLEINESFTHTAAVVQYFDINAYSLDLILARQRVYVTLPRFLHCLHDQNTVPEIIIVKLYSDKQAETYLISLQIDVESINGTTQVNERNRCAPVNTLFETKTEISPFKYHHFCRNNVSLLCFMDDSYLCICDRNHARAECFGYDQSLDRCSHCLADGQCLKENKPIADFVCICPRCHSGKICQFSSKSFSFTLDQLFSTNLASSNQAGKRTTTFSLIFGSWLLVALGLVNNGCCLVTFRRPKCQRNGIGHYLLSMSVVNQINLIFLAFRLTHLPLIIPKFLYGSLLDLVLCKLLNYFLVASSRIPYWLVALIATERAYITLFLGGQWFKRPYIAKRLMVIMLIVILSTGIYEVYFIESYVDFSDNTGAICALNFPHPYQIWARIHQFVTVTHTLLPFLINLCCTITISCNVIKMKMNINAKNIDSLRINTNKPEAIGQQEQRMIQDFEVEKALVKVHRAPRQKEIY